MSDEAPATTRSHRTARARRAEGAAQAEAAAANANVLDPRSFRSAVIVNDTRLGRHFGCEAVMQSLIVMLGQQGIRPVWFQMVNKPWEGDDEFLKAAATAEIVIVNGEGSIHHANSRAKSLAQIGALCRHTLHIPGVLLNATLHANTAEVYRNIADFDLVSVRDTPSAREAESFGIKDVLYCPDFSLFHRFETLRGESTRSAGLRVGITDSVVPEISTHLEAMRVARGYEECSIWMRRRRQTVFDYAAKVAAMDLLITGRFHSVCYALGTRTPFVAVESNTPKITSILNDVFGHARRVVSPAQLETLDLEAFSVWSAEEQAALDAFLARRRGRYSALGARIKALLPPT